MAPLCIGDLAEQNMEISWTSKSHKVASPPWPCQCISVSLWVPGQPTSQPGFWWPRDCPSEGVLAAPGSGGVCKRAERHSLAGVPAVHLCPPPLPLLWLHTVNAVSGCTALPANKNLINSFDSMLYHSFCLIYFFIIWNISYSVGQKVLQEQPVVETH